MLLETGRLTEMADVVRLVVRSLENRMKAEKQFQDSAGGKGLEGSAVAENDLGDAEAGSGLKKQIQIAGDEVDVNVEAGLGIVVVLRRSYQ
jgi:hypothetical protein